MHIRDNSFHKEVYLPKKDDWYFTDKLYKGGTTHNITVPESSAPTYFIKAGSVIPFDEGGFGFNKEEKLVLSIYAKESGSFNATLFFDDGVSYEYLNGNCALLNFTVNCEGEEVIAEIRNGGRQDIEYEIKLIDSKNRPLIIKKVQ